MRYLALAALTATAVGTFTLAGDFVLDALSKIVAALEAAP